MQRLQPQERGRLAMLRQAETRLELEMEMAAVTHSKKAAMHPKKAATHSRTVATDPVTETNPGTRMHPAAETAPGNWMTLAAETNPGIWVNLATETVLGMDSGTQRSLVVKGGLGKQAPPGLAVDSRTGKRVRRGRTSGPTMEEGRPAWSPGTGGTPWAAGTAARLPAARAVATKRRPTVQAAGSEGPGRGVNSAWGRSLGWARGLDPMQVRARAAAPVMAGETAQVPAPAGARDQVVGGDACRCVVVQEAAAVLISSQRFP